MQPKEPRPARLQNAGLPVRPPLTAPTSVIGAPTTGSGLSLVLTRLRFWQAVLCVDKFETATPFVHADTLKPSTADIARSNST